MTLVIDHHKTLRNEIHHDVALGNYTGMDNDVQSLQPNI